MSVRGLGVPRSSGVTLSHDLVRVFLISQRLWVASQSLCGHTHRRTWRPKPQQPGSDRFGDPCFTRVAHFSWLSLAGSRRLRSWWCHEQLSIAAALTASQHHSALRGQTKARAGEGDFELNFTAKIGMHPPPQA